MKDVIVVVLLLLLCGANNTQAVGVFPLKVVDGSIMSIKNSGFRQLGMACMHSSYTEEPRPGEHQVSCL